MESLRDNRRAGASVGCVAPAFETLGDAKSNHTTGAVPTKHTRFTTGSGLLWCRKSNDGAWVSESILAV